MSLVDLVKEKRWWDLELEKDRILNIEQVPGETTQGFPQQTYRYAPQHREPEALFPVMASEKEEKPELDLKRYGIKQIGQISADDEVLDVWLVDGAKIKQELDDEWLEGDEARSGFVAGHPFVDLFKFKVPPKTIIVSNVRTTPREIQESILHEYTEYLIEKRGLEYKDADAIAVQVERVASQLFDTKTKREWETMMEDVSSPPHFRTGGRKEDKILEATGEPQTGHVAFYL